MAKTVKKAAAAAAKPAEAAKTPAAETVKAPVATKATTTKTTAKPKTTKAPAKAKAAPKKAPAKTAAKTTAKASGVKVFLEYQGYQVDMDAILEAVKAASGVKTIKTMEVYVKPEDGAAYYVINGKETGKATM